MSHTPFARADRPNICRSFRLTTSSIAAGAPAMTDSVARLAKAAGARCYTDPFVPESSLSGQANLMTRFTGWFNQPRHDPIQLQPARNGRVRTTGLAAAARAHR